MSVLGDLRRELVDTIEGLTTYDHVPASVQLPAAFVMAGAPYIEAGQTFGTRHVRLQLVLLTHPASNSGETDWLDEQIEAVQKRLTDEEWTVERVEQPQLQELSGSEVLATAISVGTDVTFP